MLTFNKRVLMDRGCHFCHELCLFSFYKNTEDIVFINCEHVRSLSKICNGCSYRQTCKADSKGSCASNRKSEIKNMEIKTDEEILEYMEYMPSVNCPNEQIDLKKLTIFLAEDNWYANVHCSDDWESFAKSSGIKKSEKDYIREDFAPGFIDNAKEIIAKKESKHASLNFSNMGEKTSDCVKCPPEIKNKCIHMVLPDGWMGFPDLYLSEAMKRGILSKIR